MKIPLFAEGQRIFTPYGPSFTADIWGKCVASMSRGNRRAVLQKGGFDECTFDRSVFLYPRSGLGGPGNIRQNHPFGNHPFCELPSMGVGVAEIVFEININLKPLDLQ